MLRRQRTYAAELRSHRLTLTHRNQCIECPDASKTIGNQLPMKKYIGAVLLKSSQLELVADIGPFENPLPAQQKKQQRKSSFKKNYIYMQLLPDSVSFVIPIFPGSRAARG